MFPSPLGPFVLAENGTNTLASYSKICSYSSRIYNVGHFAKLVKFAELYNHARPCLVHGRLAEGATIRNFGSTRIGGFAGHLRVILACTTAKGSGNVRPATATGSLAARIRSCFGSLPTSETTSVPAETQLRTPCASQITGADSPVIADSSIAARPWMTSSSPGTICLAFTTTRSPGLTPSVGAQAV